ncbi:hypothetical protein [Streptomyces carpaticus]|uniref:Secreted protein n=1 Tax=Streptomyces carpaticus TaxID=285558 RepID=A0ABV4ZUA2_9ACTN
MEIAIAVMVLTFLVFVALVVRTARSVKRRAERAGRELRHKVNRTVSEATLAARAVQPGVLGEVARTRKELRGALEGTRGLLRTGAADDPGLRESLALLDQLYGHARQLDGELAALVAGEPDRRVVAARLPALRERAERIVRSAGSLRSAALERAQRHDVDALDALHAQIEVEASALRHWAPAEERPGAVPGAAAEPEPGIEGGGKRPGAGERG